jgi:hypothetical protein
MTARLLTYVSADRLPRSYRLRFSSYDSAFAGRTVWRRRGFGSSYTSTFWHSESSTEPALRLVVSYCVCLTRDSTALAR